MTVGSQGDNISVCLWKARITLLTEYTSSQGHISAHTHTHTPTHTHTHKHTPTSQTTLPHTRTLFSLSTPHYKEMYHPTVSTHTHTHSLSHTHTHTHTHSHTHTPV